MDDRISKLLAVAEVEWNLPVHEPKEKGWEQIDKYIRLGLHWAVCAQFPKYTKNGQFQWCGAFAAWCYFNVGLKQSLRAMQDGLPLKICNLVTSLLCGQVQKNLSPTGIISL
jgi:hypothetical protein